MNTLEVRWVHRSMDGLTNKPDNEGVDKDDPELDTT
jgi:hypothetical protein